MTKREWTEKKGIKVFEVNGKLYTNIHNVADIFVKAVTSDEYTRGGAKYTTSDLIKPVKAVLLEREHEGDIITDVSDIFARLRGHGLHATLERYANPNGIAEERLHMEIGGIPLSSKPDHYDGDNAELSDYKSTSVWSFIYGDKPEWTTQLNIGAHFLRHYGFKVNKLTIHAMLYDWSRNKAKREPEYIQSPFHSVDIPLWTPDEAEHFIKNRVAVLEMAEDAYKADGVLTKCTAEDRWETPTTYAVMKKGRKSALRVLNSMSEAQAYMEQKGGTHIDTRPGEAKRCELYCDAFPWCEQAGGTTWADQISHAR